VPQKLETAEINALIAKLHQKGVEGAIEVYKELLQKGYDYAGWAVGVAAGSSITGREAYDFLTKSALAGIGIEATRALTEADIKKIKVDMADAYLRTLRDAAIANGDSITRDVTYRETERFHKEVFEANRLSIENWTLKIPMDLLRMAGNDAVIERTWELIRATQGSGFDSVFVSGHLAAVVQLAAFSPDPAIRDRAQKWLDTVLGPSVAEKLKKLAGDLVKAEMQEQLNELGIDRIGYQFDFDFQRARELAIEVIRDSRLKAEDIFRTVISPIVLDLDGDGVETISIDRQVHFDHDGNSFAESTGWVGRDDGLLVYDRNGNGTVDTGAELFGSYTVLQNGSKAANGFVALAEFDLNGDHAIDAQDPVFSSLRIWRDLNLDGTTQEGELFTLHEVGVASMSTQYVNSNKVDSQGNERRQVGQYTRADGSSAQMHDVWLERNSGTAFRNAEDTVDSPAMQALPDIDGFGALPDLRDAMAEDATLRGYVEEFIAQPGAIRREQLIDLIVLRWTGADRVTFAVDSPYYDERKLFAIDVASGETVYDRNYNQRPKAGPQATFYIEQGYAALRNFVGIELERQVTLFLNNQLELRIDTQGDLYFELKDYAHLRQSNPQQALAMLTRLVQNSGEELLSLGWNGFELLRQEIAHFASDPAMAAYMRDTLNIALGAGNVRPVNTSAATVVSGSSGNDTLQGGSDTVLFAGGGDDYLSLSKTSTILFGPGDGHDRVSGGVGHTIMLDASLAPGDVTVSTVGDALMLTLPGGETLSVDGWTYGAGLSAANTPVSRVIFANGSAVWTAGDLSAHMLAGNGDDTISGTYLPEYVNGKAGNDSLTGGGGSDFIVGGAGNDTIWSGNGNDLLLGGEGDDRLNAIGNGTQSHDFLVGGPGNDYLSGDDGSDTYLFEPGFGTDTLHDFSQSFLGNDVVIFGPGLRPQDMAVIRDGYAVSVTFSGSNDKLTLEGGQPEEQIERFLFDDGTLLTTEQLMARLTYPTTDGNDTVTAMDNGATVSGRDGNDRLTGGQAGDVLRGDGGNDFLEGMSGNDTLVGGAGNDRLNGNHGADTHVIGVGDGTDVIYDGIEGGVTDTVQLDFRPDQVSVRRGGREDASLLIDIAGGTQNIEVLSWFDNDDISGSLQLRFNDGTVWSAQQLWQAAPYSATAEYRYGTPDDELLAGDGQNNIIKGQGGADTLDGGAGNDSLYGGQGDDTFVFRRGMGQDRVYDIGGFDAVSFEPGIAQSDVTLTRMGSTLRISLNATADHLDLDEYSDHNRIERLKFADGSTIDLMANASGPMLGTAGHDLLEATDQDDRIEGLSGNDSLGGNGGRDVLMGGDGDDILWGDDGADTLEGGAGSDQIHMDGKDTIVFGRGDGVDLIIRGMYDGGTLRFSAGVAPSDVALLGGPDGALLVTIAGSSDGLEIGKWFQESHPDRTLASFEFTDGTRWTLDDIRARLSMTGSIGRDYIYGTQAGDTLVGGAGQDQLSAWSGNDMLQGGEGNDTLNGSLGNDTLDGGTGNDSLSGAGGDDTYLFDTGFGADTIVEGVAGEAQTVNRIIFSSGIAAADVVVTGDNQFTPGSNGNLYLSALGTGDKLTLSKWFDPNRSNISVVQFADGTTWDRAALLEKFYSLERGGTMYGTEAGDRLTGDDGADSLRGLAGNDSMSGMGGNDELLGDMGNDTLSGGAGTDLLLGGIGDDTYLFQRGDGVDRIADFDRVSGSNDKLVFGSGISAADVIVERQDDHIVLTVAGSTNGSVDAIAIRWFGSEALRIESVVFSNGETWTASQLESMANSHGAVNGTDGADVMTGTSAADKLLGRGGDDALAGLAGDDSLEGGDGADTLDGGVGADLLTGGRGDDRYLADDAADMIVELAGEGIDTVASTLSHVLGEQVENLELIGTSLAGTGNALANRIVGGGGNDTLDGGAGADTLQGGDGNDAYVIDDAGDLVVEGAAQGVDQVTATISWRMSEGVENLTLIGDAALSGVGNAAANTITGTAKANTLDGGAGSDTLIGGMGDDVYLVDAGGDVLMEQSDQGWDRVDAAINWTLGPALEELRLLGSAGLSATGNSANNVLRGNMGDNTLNGGGGADTLTGGAGNDTYVVDNQNDSVIESAGEGAADRINASVSYTLPEHVEELAFTGTAALRGFGNEHANYMLGNAGANQLTGHGGNDTLQGGSGNDTLTGGIGDDTYIVEASGDVVIESAGDGNDTVRTGVTLTSLAANVEHLVLSGSANVNGTGNALANTITGNGGNNRLDGGAGADTLSGGMGDDTYVVDSASDVIVERSGEGSDTVQSAVSWTLGAALERLTLSGTAALHGTGNSLANTLTGNSGANRLDGGEGADTMSGGAGNDTYVVDNTGDTVTEAASGGTDTIETGLTWTLATQVENLTLTGAAPVNATGNSLANTLRGNAADNVLSGGAGNDTLIGGAGNDTYVVDVATDVVTEDAGEGTDSVRSTATWTLGSNLENLTLMGSATISGTGNMLDNVIVGNSGNNRLTGLSGDDTLDGGAGNDTLVGGAGNDTYLVNVVTDVVTESASEGTDTVKAPVSWTLGANLENLTLTGSAAINGTGNAMANVLTGNAGANVLRGDAGDDSYDGGAGNDTFNDTSTSSNDTYLWGIGSGLDSLTDAGGILDHVDLAAGIAKSQLNFAKNGNDLVLGVTGQSDRLTIKSWYSSTANQIEEFRLADGSKVLASEVAGLISAMASFVPMASVTGGQAERSGLDATMLTTSSWVSTEEWARH
jgi:Ca2+-binding RTX toxin-like protein